jgi:hypothetical protein
MSVFQKHQARDLLEWLAIATKELAPPAKKRIVLEIEAHYAEAVAAHLAEGLCKSDAAREALAELGDAEEAAKRLRRQHLTECNAKQVEWALKQVGSYWQLLGSYLAFLLFFLEDTQISFIRLSRRELAVSLSVWFYAFVVVPTASFVMVRRKSKNIGFLFLMQVAMGAFLVCSSYFLYGLGHYMGFAYLAIICFFLPELRIWLKFRHVANVWDEMPLRNE